MGIKSVYAYFTSSFIIPLLGERFGDNWFKLPTVKFKALCLLKRLQKLERKE